MTDQISLQLPDKAVDNLASIFKSEKVYLQRSSHQGEVIFSLCQYIGQHIGITFIAPTIGDVETPQGVILKPTEGGCSGSSKRTELDPESPPFAGLRMTGEGVRDGSVSFLKSIESIAKASHVRIRWVTLEGGWWHQDAGHLIAMTKAGIPCALVPTSTGGYHMVSPEEPTPVYVTEEVASTISSKACSFYRALPDKNLSLKEIFQFALSNLWPDFWRLFTFQASISLIGLLIPIMTGLIIETIIPTADFSLLSQAIIGLIVIAFATTAFRVSQVIAMMRLKFKTNVTVQAAVWDRVLRLPMNFFRDFTAGDLATRVNGIDTIQQTLNGTVLSGILGGVFSVFTLVLMFFYDPFVGFVILGLALLGGLVSIFGIYIQLKYQRQLLYLRGKNANLVFQFLNGMSKLRAHVRETAAFLQWSDKYAQIAKTFKKLQIIGIRMNIFQTLYGGIFLILFFLTIMQRIDTLSFSGFVALNAAMAQFRVAFSDLFGVLGQTLNIIPLYERVKPILTSVPEIEKEGIHPGVLDGEVTLRNIGFYYKPGDPFVFADLNLTFKPGQFVALVGPSGAGKSTLFRLLLGFETPQEGKVLYDGKNLSTLNIRAVRQQLGVVLQTTTLLTGSILENIIGNHPSLTLEDAREAARLAAIDAYIHTLPMGMQTLISEEGRTFSMGQRQRLMIARALAARPKILLLDEATSALDNATQAIAQKNLEKLKITRIVAAHRLSTIMNADWIYVFNEKGRVVQQGVYSDLLGSEGIFKDLVKRQM